jgi:hypothetical protein
MNLCFRYTGGQLFNYKSDYGAKIIRDKLPEWHDIDFQKAAELIDSLRLVLNRLEMLNFSKKIN